MDSVFLSDFGHFGSFYTGIRFGFSDIGPDSYRDGFSFGFLVPITIGRFFWISGLWFFFGSLDVGFSFSLGRWML